MAILTLKAQQDHLQKVASVRDPIKAIAEFVWNGLDADATEVDVGFARNTLGGIEAITIKDNGNGITRERAERDFENIGASWKRHTPKTKTQRVIHGKEGQGRLRFFSHARLAEWASCYLDEDKYFQLTIKIDANALQKADVSEPTPCEHSETGTTVKLSALKNTYDWLVSEEARSAFGAIFAPYIMHYPSVNITYDGVRIDPAQTVMRSYDFPIEPVVCPSRTIKDLNLKVIEWRANSDSRKIHFGGEKGIVLGSQAANVIAPDFNFSAYAYSPFFQEISDANLLEFDNLSDPDFARIIEYIRGKLSIYFRSRQDERSNELINDLKAAGVYPYEGDPQGAVERKEREVFDMATHAVSSYSKAFKKADAPLKKITLSLLKEAVRNNPESISNILHAVFKLPKTKQDEFSGLLNKTELANIISASSLISERIVTLEMLKAMVFEPKHKKHIKERGELDILVRDNTWLFGENFHMTVPESGLTKVINRVLQELVGKGTKRKIRKPDGKIGRVDLLLGREIPQPKTEHREFLIVELKRPSLTIGRTELDQLEDYANTIKAQPDFKGTSTYWDFYLITGEYDDTVNNRIKQKGRPDGLFVETENSKIWVKTWGQIIRESEGRIKFVQDKLKIEVSTDDIENKIANLKLSMLRYNPNDVPDQNKPEDISSTKVMAGVQAKSGEDLFA